MLDIRFVREHLDEVATAMQNRNHTWDSARFQELDESRRASIAKEEELQAKRNAISKSIGKLMGEGKKEEAEAQRPRFPSSKTKSLSSAPNALQPTKACAICSCPRRTCRLILLRLARTKTTILRFVVGAPA